jgi:PTS system fructose-specific IIC component/PTS system nitrogen regulatory IIA component
MPSRPLTLGELFPVDRIAIDVASVDKEALFEELVDLIGSTSSFPLDRSAALACVMEREALMSTAIREGVAVPHGKSDGIGRMVGAIGISRRGIDYDAFDGNPVKIAFMILSPRHDPETHLRTLKMLAGALDAPGFVESLLAARDSAEAFRVIEAFEDQLGMA